MHRDAYTVAIEIGFGSKLYVFMFVPTLLDKTSTIMASLNIFLLWRIVLMSALLLYTT